MILFHCSSKTHVTSRAGIRSTFWRFHGEVTPREMLERRNRRLQQVQNGPPACSGKLEQDRAATICQNIRGTNAPKSRYVNNGSVLFHSASGRLLDRPTHRGTRFISIPKGEWGVPCCLRCASFTAFSDKRLPSPFRVKVGSA